MTLGGDGTPTGKKVSRLQSSLNRKFSSLSNRMEAAVVSSGGRRSLLGTPTTIPEESSSVGEWEVGSFCLSISALQRLMNSEQVLMVGIIPHQYQKKIFEIIARDSVDLVMNEGEQIIHRVKKAVGNNDFLAIMSIFHVIKHLMQVFCNQMLKIINN